MNCATTAEKEVTMQGTAGCRGRSKLAVTEAAMEATDSHHQAAKDSTCRGEKGSTVHIRRVAKVEDDKSSAMDATLRATSNETVQ